ncbi:MAG TPA: hypothetical protein VHV79_03145 [Mycobacteriales bacterium]|jgi:hypothetical protein|nr:hypothetical protein [Mycobacteriales bacterium]
MKGLWAIAIVMTLGGLGLVAGGAVRLHQGESGLKAVATVSECHAVSNGKTTSEECSGAWIQGGSLLGNGHVVLGTIDGASSGDVGKNLHVRIHGGTAYTPSLRLSIVLFVLGGLIALFGVYFCWAVATGRAYAKRKPRAPAPAVT